MKYLPMLLLLFCKVSWADSVVIATCFSPAEDCSLRLASFIEKAESRVDIAVYDINLQNVADLLIKKKAIVRVVVDKRQSRGSHSLVPYLVRGGVRLRIARSRGLMHDKFVVVDDGLETGSFNYTNHATRANFENQVYMEGAVVSSFRAEFQRIWDHSL